MKRQAWISTGIVVVFLVLSGYLYLHSGLGAGESGEAESGGWEAGWTTAAPSGEAGEESSGECTVYICGAVKHPGVYSFPSGSRVCDAVNAAGGFRKKASRSAVNQARMLVDGEQITIPQKKKKTKESSGSFSDGASSSQGSTSLVNINDADLTELMTLSGIGEAKAQLIIDYREENGSFQSKEDIMNISGIKEGTYEKIKDSITI
jgi:competence protein ComEA